MTKSYLRPELDRELRRTIAWAVHAFTTCGIILGFLALLAVLKGDAVTAFIWLGLALLVDGIDGSLARKARVLEYTPNFDGRTLDNVIDYFTYVAVPALMIYWFEMVPPGWSSISAAAIMAVSCYSFANLSTKSEDYYFVGFPALWNIVVLYFYLLNMNHWINLIVVIMLCILTFVPIKYVHPLRVTDWRNFTIPATILWAAMTLSLIISSKDAQINEISHQTELTIWVLTSLYFIGISLWRTFIKYPPESEESRETPTIESPCAPEQTEDHTA